MSQMFTSVPTIGRASAPHLLDRAFGAIASLSAHLAGEWRVHHAAMQIEALDDRGLADIGLGHGQSESAARYGRSRMAQAAARRTPEAPLMPASFTEWR